VVEGHDADVGEYPFEFDYLIALVGENGLIFSFIWNVQD
jgi:hypothetical protein